MKTALSSLCLTVLTVGRLAAQTSPIEQMEASTVRVFSVHGDQMGTGSGFVIGDGSYVVTNHHVIADASEVIVLAKNLKMRNVRVALDNPGKDIAILQLDRNSGRPGVTLATRASVQKTQNVYAAGFPSAGDEQGKNLDNIVEVKFSQGIISGFVKGENGEALYQISAALNPGNSGGPLFDTCGRVIGIDSMKSLRQAVTVGQDGKEHLERLPYGEGVAWAIQSDELVALLGSTGVAPTVETTTCEARATQTKLTTPGGGTETARVNTSSSGFGSTQLLILIGAAGLALLLVTFFVFRSRQQPAFQSPSPMPPPMPAMPDTRPLYQPPPPARTVVRCIAGTHAGMEFDLSTIPTVMGRDPRLSQIVFDSNDPVVSKRHCTVRMEAGGGAIILEDCGSTNGTFLENGERLRAGEQRRLPNQSRFYLGDRNHLFQVG